MFLKNFFMTKKAEKLAEKYRKERQEYAEFRKKHTSDELREVCGGDYELFVRCENFQSVDDRSVKQILTNMLSRIDYLFEEREEFKLLVFSKKTKETEQIRTEYISSQFKKATHIEK